MNKSITIPKQNLIDVISGALQYAGSTDWDVYVSIDGDVDTRHNTHDSDGWFEILDLCNSCVEDGEGRANDAPDYDFDGVAEWIVNDCDWLPSEVEDFCPETLEDITYNLIIK